MRFVLENYGCTLNQAQGEMISSYLISQGHQLVDREEEADSVLLSTCVVIKQTEDRMRRIREIKDSGKDVLLSGCLTHLSPGKCSYNCDFIPILNILILRYRFPVPQNYHGICAEA